MDLFFKKTLFDKHLFVNDYPQPSNDATEIRYALAQKLGIWVESGWEDLHLDEIRLASEKLGRFVPEAFYANFPESVQALSGFTLYLDQMLHYAKTYGRGDFDQPGRSLFEEEIKRSAMSEKVKPQTFRMISEKEAEKVLADLAEDLLSSTRPLSPDRFEFLKNYILSVNPPVRHCACKDTAIRLLLETRDFSFSHFLSLSDVMNPDVLRQGAFAPFRFLHGFAVTEQHLVPFKNKITQPIGRNVIGNDHLNQHRDVVRFYFAQNRIDLFFGFGSA